MSANVISDAKRARARKHASRSIVCACGKVCHGNGGISSHRRACPLRKAKQEQT
jgi:hypothetical protein